MQHGWRVAGLAVALAAVAATTACGGSDDTVGGTSPAAGTSSVPAGTTSSTVQVATAAPGTYGVPSNSALPNPTGVATDPPVPTPAKDDATVVVTYSGWTDATVGVEVGAYVTGVSESGGTCTLTLTSGSRTLTSQVQGEPDASSTSCPNLALAGPDLSSGTWTAVVDYDSSSTSGESEPQRVVVP